MPENPKQKELRKIRDKEIYLQYPNLTMEEIAKRYMITKQRIWQIIKKYEKQ